MNKVKKVFVSKGIIQPGGWFILSKSDAMDFVSACKKENIVILGIDGFFLFSDGIQPSIEHSVDFSTNHYMQKTDSIYNDAIEFLKNTNENLFFEIVCSD
jgi:hypothetical protein